MGLAAVDRIGSRVGPYRLARRIGAGGTSTVYLASSDDGQLVAIKLLHPDVAEEPRKRRRFLREGYVANEIDHPGVVRVLGAGETDDGAPYLVMEYLDGESVENRRIRKGGKLPLEEAVWVADETLAILAAAHAKGIVHRDVKPENLFWTNDAHVKLLDFGIARLEEGEALTTAGTVLGTLAFMAPEQARGDRAAVGEASDVWAVGATLFTLLSGRHVRADEGIDALLEAARRSVPPLSEVAPDVPTAIVNVVDAALSFDPKIRWPSAVTMRRGLNVAWEEVKRERARPHGWGTATDSYDVVRVHASIQPPPASVRRTSTRRPQPLPTTEPPTGIVTAPSAFRVERARVRRQTWVQIGIITVVAIVAFLLGALVRLR